MLLYFLKLYSLSFLENPADNHLINLISSRIPKVLENIEEYIKKVLG